MSLSRTTPRNPRVSSVNNYRSVIALVATLSFPFAVSADIVIDNFNTMMPLIQSGVGTNSRVTVDGTVLGGTRTDTVEVTNQGMSTLFGTLGFNGNFSVAQGANDRIRGNLAYDGFGDANGFGGGAIDLTQGGNNALNMMVLDSDLNDAINGVFSITASSDMVTFQEVSLPIPANAGLPMDIQLAFSSFTGVDFGQLRYLSVNFDFANAPGRDVIFGAFSAINSQVVPEPGMIWLLGTGMMLAASFRRRRRR